jgi:hypothetical protein
MNTKRLVVTLLVALAVSIGFQFLLIGMGREAVIRGGVIAVALVAGFAVMGRFSGRRDQRSAK